MNFAFPHALAIAAAIIPVSFILYLWKSRWSRRQLSGVVAPRLAEQLTRSIDWGKRRAKAVLFVLALVFMLVAIGRPQWGLRKAELDRNGVDVLIGLDLSRSMLAEDEAGTARLKAAKDGIQNLVNLLGSNDRVGLIGFAGEAFVAAPITQDFESVKRNLEALDPKIVARPGSDLGAAIRLADRTFESGKFETKALVLVTDGEQLQGDAVIAAREAAQHGMRIFTVGAGSMSGARIPERQKNGSVRFVKNEFGNEVVSRLNQRVLQQVAASGKGLYEGLGEKGQGLQAVYEQGVEPHAHEKHEKQTEEPAEYFQWPLGLAIFLFLAEMLVNERRKPATVPVT